MALNKCEWGRSSYPSLFLYQCLFLYRCRCRFQCPCLYSHYHRYFVYKCLWDN